MSCNICESSNSQEISTQGRFGLSIRTVVCKNCGLVFTNPRLDVHENEMFYQHFYKIFFRGEDSPSTKHVETQYRKAKACVQYLELSGIDVSSINSVMDVGCSAGGILDYFKKSGVSKTVGVEPSLKYADFARDTLNLDVHTATLEQYLDNNLGEKFDLIIMRDVVEHLLDPKGVLTDLHKILHKNSIIFIETNNVFKSLNPTLKYGYQFHYAHPYIFSVNSLTRILNLSGYTTVSTKDQRYLACIAKPTSGTGIPTIKDSYLSVINHMKNHDRYLWLTNIIFTLRVGFAKLRGR